MATHTTLSVRGEARRTVAPDYAVVRLDISAVPAARADALDQLRASQGRLTAALVELGGARLTVQTDGSGLTWSFGSIAVQDQYDHRSGKDGRTGRVVAGVSAVITVRDLDRLASTGDVLGEIEHLDVHQVGWHVDPGNSAWPVVRADAVAAALAKARDYATALGGTVVGVEHVADTGLLTGSEHEIEGGWVEHGAVAASAGAAGGGLPTLDPVPQEIRAVVEARVTAEIDPSGLG